MPLALDLSFPPEWKSSRKEFVFEGLLQIIYDHSSRWETLRVAYLNEYVAMVGAFNGERLPLPNLRHLEFFSPESYNRRDLGGPFITRFLNCPALTSFSSDLTGAANRLSLPWAQLRAVELRDAHGEDAFTVLARSRNVRDIKLIDINQNWRPYTGNVIELKTARSLLIRGQSSTKMIDADLSLLQYLTLPKLSTLEISTTFDSDEALEYVKSDQSFFLESFIRRSSCSITTLRLGAVALTDTQVLSLLRVTPALESLSISEYTDGPTNKIVTSRFSGALFMSRMGPKSRPSFLSSLSTVKLRIHVGDLDEQALLAALASRYPDPQTVKSKAGGACLTSLNITLMLSSQDESDALGLPVPSRQNFTKGGVQFSLSYTFVED